MNAESSHPEPSSYASTSLLERGVTHRHREVLDAALELLAEQGYAGASLRLLASRVGMKQPSLYHYFASKEQLIEQIVALYGEELFAAAAQGGVACTRLADIPARIVDGVRRVYELPRYALFFRMLFTISRSHPRFGLAMREAIVGQGERAIDGFIAPFVARGEIAEEPARMAVRLLSGAAVQHMLEELVLYDERVLGPATDRYLAFIADAGRRLLADLAARP